MPRLRVQNDEASVSDEPEPPQHPQCRTFMGAVLEHAGLREEAATIVKKVASHYGIPADVLRAPQMPPEPLSEPRPPMVLTVKGKAYEVAARPRTTPRKKATVVRGRDAVVTIDGEELALSNVSFADPALGVEWTTLPRMKALATEAVKGTTAEDTILRWMHYQYRPTFTPPLGMDFDTDPIAGEKK